MQAGVPLTKEYAPKYLKITEYFQKGPARKQSYLFQPKFLRNEVETCLKLQVILIRKED